MAGAQPGLRLGLLLVAGRRRGGVRADPRWRGHLVRGGRSRHRGAAGDDLGGDGDTLAQGQRPVRQVWALSPAQAAPWVRRARAALRRGLLSQGASGAWPPGDRGGIEKSAARRRRRLLVRHRSGVRLHSPDGVEYVILENLVATKRLQQPGSRVSLPRGVVSSWRLEQAAQHLRESGTPLTGVRNDEEGEHLSLPFCPVARDDPAGELTFSYDEAGCLQELRRRLTAV